MTVEHRPDIFRTLATAAVVSGSIYEVMNFCIIEFGARGNSAGLLLVLEVLQTHCVEQGIWSSKLSQDNEITNEAITAIVAAAEKAQGDNMKGLASLLRILASHLSGMQIVCKTHWLPEDIQNIILLKYIEEIDAFYIA
jgi:hypothetical protein